MNLNKMWRTVQKTKRRCGVQEPKQGVPYQNFNRAWRSGTLTECGAQKPKQGVAFRNLNMVWRTGT
jgi:hypothetical protein